MAVFDELTLEAPWYTFAKKLYSLFKLDDKIHMDDLYRDDDGPCTYALDIIVEGHEKLAALQKMLPRVKTFGNVTLALNLMGKDSDDYASEVETFKTIFEGNRILKDIRELEDPSGTKHAYVRFQPEVVQFFDDDLSDYNGNCTCLAQDIAKEVFEGANCVNFCTADVRENEDMETPMGKPLGEWP